MSKIYLYILTSILLLMSLIVPLFEFPDEQAHIESVEFLATHGRMPAGDEWDMSAEMQRAQTSLGVFRDSQGNNKVTYHPEYRPEFAQSLVGKDEVMIKTANTPENRNTYVAKEAARYPRLYYDYMSMWYGLVENKDIILRTHVMRIGNAALALATAMIIYRMGWTIFLDRTKATIIATLVLLQPMYTFLSAGINSDNLHNLLFAILIYCGLLIVMQGITRKNLVMTGVTLILDFMTKPQAYVALPIILTAYLIYVISHKKWKLLKTIALSSLMATIFVTSPLNPYRGWVLSPNIYNTSVVDFVRFSLNKLVAQNIVWYWGVFKWLGVVLPPLYWQIANRIVVVGGIGLVVYAWRALRRERLIVAPPVVMYLIATVVIYTLAIYYFDWQYVKSVGYSIGVQARYLFPTISAQMALLMIGLLSFSARARYRQWVLIGLSLFIVWMQLGGIWRLATSYYDVSSLQTFITQASQYKPLFAKGQWWYLWIGLYFGSILALLGAVLVQIRHDAQTETPTSKRT